MADKKKLAILAIGGNSLILDKDHKSVPDQYDAVEQTCTHIAGLVKKGYRVVITHGNGPQVGFILRRSELSRSELHDVPLDSCGADTQGAIGYQIQQAMANVTKSWTQKPMTATVVTQVLVDRADPSFAKPSKPIGSFMPKEEADEHKAKEGWDIVEDAGRGFRRVVASPIPKKILELDAIKALLEKDMVVVAVGGGGIPVVLNPDGRLVGIAAVIDKDLASSLIARDLNADVLIISTAVDQVCLNFNKPDEKRLSRITLADAQKYMAEGHFAAGSMKPKIAAVIEFLEGGGKEALITDPAHLVDALEGKAGTWIVA
ncbi:MAG: carbamate kinase [Candidatus Riflebacteria bacterium]|nr:carbamate kinase [Candidatus Riflebacteria bacterium]